MAQGINTEQCWKYNSGSSTFASDILQRKETWKHLCHMCDYATNKKDSLTKHLYVHGIGDRFKCDQCNKDFRAKQKLQIHMKTHGSCTEKCHQCGKMYKSLKSHIANVHAEKQLECDECEKMFSTVRT